MIKLTTNEIRKLWISFFEEKKHLFLPPQSLIPKNDPSLLWINSGVATLKDYFSGIKNPPCNRIVNIQKSIRTNDIENVGVTARHHTIFEMLGNFSIGDYFKEEAIEFGFEFLTKKLNIEIEKLYITVFNDDEIAYNKWIELGIIKNHIIKNGRERNFWDVGQGPCGPCTEIFYDRGEKFDKEKIAEKLFFEDIENDRYVEIWNIVFSQFNNDGKNNYTELARKNIDTGAGLERIACISQDVPTNFDSDMYLPIINTLEQLSNLKYLPDAYFDKNNTLQNEINRCYRVICDHIKTNVFAIADGAIPSNKERGSILRRLIRRAMVCAKKINLDSSFIIVCVDAIINNVVCFYPYLNEQKNKIIEIIENEAKLFSNTLEKGYILFENEIKNSKKMDTSIIFKLTETYGFPYEIVKELCLQNNIEINEKEYSQMLEKHKDISRNNQVIKGMVKQNEWLINFKEKSVFDYELLNIRDAKIIALFDKEFHPLKELNGDGWIVFDKTCFYATSGGQIHDNGIIKINNNTFFVDDVIKGPNEQHFHNIDTDGITINIGDNADLEIDKKFRKNVSSNHTCEHILEHVLNKTIDNSIKQEGAFKTDAYFTFDFILNRKLSEEEINLVSSKVNEIINNSCNVTTTLKSLANAKGENTIGHFDDVYKKINGDLRVVEIENINDEICGGTHVSNTNQIEKFMIVEYIPKGTASWRIRAITSNQSIDKHVELQIDIIRTEIEKLKEELNSLSINNEELSLLFAKLNFSSTNENFILLTKTFKKIKEFSNELIIQKTKDNNLLEISNIYASTKYFSLSGKITYLFYNSNNSKNIIAALKNLSNENKNVTFILIANCVTKIQYYALCSSEQVYDCNECIKKINLICDGSGGGSKVYAQGGTNDVSKFSTINDFVKNL